MKSYNIYNASIHHYPIVISLPHSGTFIPHDIRAQLIKPLILPNMDWFLRELYYFLLGMEITVIQSNISRYVIDLNRSIDNGSGHDYSKSLVYENTTFNRSMYSQPIDDNEIEKRIKLYYLPYHNSLNLLLQEKLKVYSKVYLLDLHSFFVQMEQDVCLGNANGTTSLKYTMELLKNNLLNENFTVAENKILTGGNIIRHYRSLFGDKLECIQMELRYTAYIENRYFKEEEVIRWDDKLFTSSQMKLKRAFEKTFSAFL